MRVLGRVTPTPEQLTILADNKPGIVLIRGAAGSGKTTTALLRLKQLCAAWLARRERLGLSDPVRVLVLTYNRTLEGYVSELARHQVKGNQWLHLEVHTFAKWATAMLGYPDVLSRPQMAGMVRPLVASLKPDPEFLIDEVEYLLCRFRPGHLEDYVTARRDGRGTAPRVEADLRRSLLDDVVEPYTDQKQRKGRLDWNDVAVEAADVDDVPPWDVVIVDEAQDFSANQIRAVLAHLAEQSSATLVMDAAQRIYPRYFTWKEAGIDSFSQNQKLRRNYRNTAEIAALARPLVEGLPLGDDGAIPDFDACETTGDLPIVVAGTYSEQVDYVLDRLRSTVDFTTESIAFLQPRGGAWFDYLRVRLRTEGIEYVELTRNSVWPSGPEAVALCTLHSAKGLEFDHVVIPGLNQEVTPHGAEEGDTQLDSLRRLVAMGIGRARSTVTLGYKPDDASTIIGMLKPDTYHLVEL